MLLFFLSSPLLSSAITQHSCVFPIQILSPCITTEVLLTIPVDYLCALALYVCAPFSLHHHMLQTAAKSSGIDIQALQAFGAEDIWWNIVFNVYFLSVFIYSLGDGIEQKFIQW